MRLFSRRNVLVAGVMLPVLLAGCGSPDGGSGAPSTDATSGGSISIVASTNVYGSIAQAVGGDAVRVTSIISDPDQDPHSYQANTQVALELSKASIVIENGGGYDDFVDTMLKASDNQPMVLNAVDISGHTAPPGGELNEHVWYDFPSMKKLADQLASDLGTVDTAHADSFTSNAKSFGESLDKLITDEATLKQDHGGEGVGITEPVPVYLLDAAGLVNKTPEEFSEAVEEGDDVAPAVLKEALDLYAEQSVQVLVYNEQTSGPITDQVVQAAHQASVPVVAVTETLPEGKTYLSWMQDNLDNLRTALDQT